MNFTFSALTLNSFLFGATIKFSPQIHDARALNIHCFRNSFIYLTSYAMHKRCRKQVVSLENIYLKVSQYIGISARR